jgi:hypothetical protein
MHCRNRPIRCGNGSKPSRKLRLKDIGFHSLTEALDTTTARSTRSSYVGALAEFECGLIRDRTRAPSEPCCRAARWSHRRRAAETHGRRHRGRQGDAIQSGEYDRGHLTRPSSLPRFLTQAPTPQGRTAPRCQLKPSWFNIVQYVVADYRSKEVITMGYTVRLNIRQSAVTIGNVGRSPVPSAFCTGLSTVFVDYRLKLPVRQLAALAGISKAITSPSSADMSK